ncbi:myb-related protein 2-like [Forsythia ovata]|uniref:Myb-related protein 2-like n=1 Tax=Forsythia ovata TaxID=205694 RepID=A0ABD1VI52_9LAMI
MGQKVKALEPGYYNFRMVPDCSLKGMIMLEKTELRLCEDLNDSSRFLCATNDNVEKAFDIKENSRNLSIVIGPQRGQRNDGSSYSEERFREADTYAKYFDQDAYRPEKQKTTREFKLPYFTTESKHR